MWHGVASRFDPRRSLLGKLAIGIVVLAADQLSRFLDAFGDHSEILIGNVTDAGNSSVTLTCLPAWNRYKGESFL